MEIREVLKSQYLAALEMLRQVIVKCPEALWNNPQDQNKFWHLSYHALFYTHLYLQNSGQDFTPWSKHRPEYEFLGALPWPPHEQPQIGEPYTKEDVLEFHQFVQGQAIEKIAGVDLEGVSGFSWLPFGKLELMIYNLRHLQQHTGELCERLGTQANMDVDWVGTKAGV